jgi:hypothetical protein
MFDKSNLVSREWTVTIKLWADEREVMPRDLTGYSALCLEMLPHGIDCHVEIVKPKSRGTLRAVFTDTSSPSTLPDGERISCHLGLLSGTGNLEKLVGFSFGID